MLPKMKYILLASMVLSIPASQAGGHAPQDEATRSIHAVIERFETIAKIAGPCGVDLKKLFNAPVDRVSANALLSGSSPSYEETTLLTRYIAGRDSAPTFGEVASFHGWGTGAVSTDFREAGIIHTAYRHNPKNAIGNIGSEAFWALPLSQAFGPGTVETNEYRKELHEFLRAAFTENFYPRTADWLNSQDLTLHELQEKILPPYKEQDER